MKPCPTEYSTRVTGYLEERFGLPRELFDGYALWLGSGGRIYLGPLPPSLPVEIATCGLMIARVQRTIKPSTALFQLLGYHVTRARIELTDAQTKAYVAGEDVAPSPEQIADVRIGYVCLTHDGIAIGCGLLKNGMIENVLPKAVRLKLSYV